MPFLSGFTLYRVILASLKNKNILNGLKSGENTHCFFCPSEENGVSEWPWLLWCVFMYTVCQAMWEGPWSNEGFRGKGELKLEL